MSPVRAAPACEHERERPVHMPALPRGEVDMAPRYPDIHVQLSGLDGNAFAIMGRVRAALLKAGVSRDEVAEYLEQSQSGDYDALLRTAMEWVEVA